MCTNGLVSSACRDFARYTRPVVEPVQGHPDLTEYQFIQWIIVGSSNSMRPANFISNTRELPAADRTYYFSGATH
jgi:hypothetical protein